jgi:hypothetical protein
MEVLDPVSLIAGLRRVEIGSAAQSEIVAALESIRQIRARVDAGEIALARRLREFTALSERDVSKAAQRSSRHGDRIRDRADTAAAIPSLGDALDAGEISGEHVDAVSKAIKAAPPEIRAELRNITSDLVSEVARSGLTPDDVAQRLAAETKQLEADDGTARLERQRRATRLRTWTDKHDGMFRIAGRFDPYSGVAIQGRLNAAMAAMFANGLPELAPDDPGERQDFLRALAFLALTAGVPAKDKRTAKRSSPNTAETNAETDADADNINGSGDNGDEADDLAWAPFATTGPPRFGRPEVTVVVDYTQLDPDGRPTVDWGTPANLPFSCITDLMKHAAVFGVVVHNGNVVDPDGQLDLERTTRLANRAQRRALRGLYRTCAVPGCNVPYDFTEPHHINYWRNGGTTNLSNLLPLCSHHHGCAHSGWTFALGPNRELTITLPSGQTMSTGPPNRRAAG